MTDMIPLSVVDGAALRLEMGSLAQMPPKARRTRRSAVTARAA